MRTSLFLIVALAVFSCAAPKPKPTGVHRKALTTEPWGTISDQCTLLEDMSVSCKMPWFQNQVDTSLDIYESALHYMNEHDRLSKLVNVDQRQCDSEKNALQNKLSSPWRSPYLWGASGIVLGLAAGMVVHAATQ